jgi:hypothetical protein
MHGYVAKKGNRWYAVIYDGINPATGKEQRRWVAAGTRKGDAEKLVTELVKRRNEGESTELPAVNGMVRSLRSAGGEHCADVTVSW